MTPFRAEHVGSLLRPPRLREAFRARAAGAIEEARFREIQDEAVREAVRRQEDVGLRSITDGELRRPSYWARFVERVDGLEVREARFAFHDGSGRETAFTAPHVAGRIARRRPIAVDELAFLRGTTRQTPKITLPSPPTMHFWRLDEAIEPGVYADRGEMFADLARVYREEIAALSAAGATRVQLDDVPMAMLCDAAVRERVAAAGLDPDRLLDDYVELCNASLAGRPDGLAVALHLCRGNYKGRFLSEGGYEPVAQRLFGGLAVDAFLLEYDTPRAGDFAPLRFVPGGRIAVLGLVSTKTPELEPADALAARIDEAARHLPLEQLAVSPQCGFASTAAGNPVTEAVQWAKLARVVETAALVWGEA